MRSSVAGSGRAIAGSKVLLFIPTPHLLRLAFRMNQCARRERIGTRSWASFFSNTTTRARRSPLKRRYSISARARMKQERNWQDGTARHSSEGISHKKAQETQTKYRISELR